MNAVSPSNGMQSKSISSRIVIVALGVICILLMSGLILTSSVMNGTIYDRDTTIDSLKAQIVELNRNITDLEGNVSSLNSTAIEQGNYVRLLDETIFKTGDLIVHDGVHSGEWDFRWSQVATLNQSELSDNKTPTFHINSDYHLWRFNSTFAQLPNPLNLNLYQDMGPEKGLMVSFSIGPSSSSSVGHSSWYFFDYTRSDYHFEFVGSLTGMGNWTITIEQLVI